MLFHILAYPVVVPIVWDNTVNLLHQVWGIYPGSMLSRCLYLTTATRFHEFHYFNDSAVLKHLNAHGAIVEALECTWCNS